MNFMCVIRHTYIYRNKIYELNTLSIMRFLNTKKLKKYHWIFISWLKLLSVCLDYAKVIHKLDLYHYIYLITDDNYYRVFKFFLYLFYWRHTTFNVTKLTSFIRLRCLVCSKWSNEFNLLLWMSSTNSVFIRRFHNFYS